MTSPVEFTPAIRRLAHTRDLSRCQRCGRYLPDGGHLHHRKLRSQGGKGDIENASLLCPGCHNWVHQFVAAATASGLIVPSWADPEATPVITWRGPMVLDTSGGFTVHITPTVPTEW